MVSEALGLISQFLTIYSAVLPDYTLEILIIGKVLNSAAGVIGGICRSPMINHLARANNFADCNAKEGNQSRTMKIFLIGIGYKFLIWVNSDPSLAFISFTVLSIVKLFCQYKAAQTL